MSLILQPEKLGEIEVDIFKRGNSVKISLSGNSQTMGILSANQFELRNQLMSVGLENASFKFNEDGKNGQSGYREQQRDNLDEETKDELQQLFEIDVTERVSA
jgi:flagellar hook-length control protein FliK